MKTRMFLTFDHLDEQKRQELLRVLSDATESMPARWAMRVHLALGGAEFVDLAMVMPLEDMDDHPKREDEP